MTRFRTLRTQLALAVSGLLTVVLVLFGLFVYLRLAQSLNAARDNTLALSAAQAIAAVNIENNAVNLQDSVPTEEAAAALQGREITIRVFGQDGHVVEAYGRYAQLPISAAALAVTDPANGLYETVTPRGPSNGSVRLYTVPIVQAGRRIGFVQVGQSLGDIEDTLQRLLALMAIGGPLLVVAGGLGSYVLVSRALAPIAAITRTAGEIADSGDLSARLALTATTNEVARLGITFDRMLARLDRSFQRERQFTADVSHELRTPLAAMRAILNVVRSERRTVDDYELALDDLSAETERLQGLIEALLIMARAESAALAAFEPLDLAALVDDVVEALRPLAEAKGLYLTSDLARDLTLRADRDALVRLFVNVVDNAILYTPQGGVTLRVRREGNLGRVDISDTGIGIAPEHLAHIFERFYRVENARTTRGAGLGLSLASAIATAHGGALTVESQPGRGTILTVRLPLALD